MVVAAAMPMASEATEVSVKTGLRPSIRSGVTQVGKDGHADTRLRWVAECFRG